MHAQLPKLTNDRTEYCNNLDRMNLFSVALGFRVLRYCTSFLLILIVRQKQRTRARAANFQNPARRRIINFDSFASLSSFLRMLEVARD